jgi:hypothetical protein
MRESAFVTLNPFVLTLPTRTIVSPTRTPARCAGPGRIDTTT